MQWIIEFTETQNIEGIDRHSTNRLLPPGKSITPISVVSRVLVFIKLHLAIKTLEHGEVTRVLANCAIRKTSSIRVDKSLNGNDEYHSFEWRLNRYFVDSMWMMFS